MIASLGHHTDRTLLDDVAAVSCSTPTHAAEAAVPVDVNDGHDRALHAASSLSRHGRRAVLERLRLLARLARVPGEHVARHRRELHQGLRELRASAARNTGAQRAANRTRAEVLRRKAAAARGASSVQERRRLDGLRLALAAHEPQRVLERGYAIVEGREGELVATARRARDLRDLRIRFADAAVDARVQDA